MNIDNADNTNPLPSLHLSAFICVHLWLILLFFPRRLPLRQHEVPIDAFRLENLHRAVWPAGEKGGAKSKTK